MPINKNALLRYQILDRCFSDRHRRYGLICMVRLSAFVKYVLI